LTLLWADANRVVQTKTVESDGYTSLQVGAGARRGRGARRGQGGRAGTLPAHVQAWCGVAGRERALHAAGAPDGADGVDAPASAEALLRAAVASARVAALPAVLREFRVSPDALLRPGTPLSAAHFSPGQYVRVSAATRGKGFQGGMKRHGFAGAPASHGAGPVHRSIGSTGQRKSPGRTFRGKKMPGRMGGNRRTVEGVFVHAVDGDRDLVWVRGQVPGPTGAWVEVADCARREARRGGRGEGGRTGCDGTAERGRPFPTAGWTEGSGLGVERARTDRPLRPGEPLSL